jgi:hypothetical protein
VSIFLFLRILLVALSFPTPRFHKVYHTYFPAKWVLNIAWAALKTEQRFVSMISLEKFDETRDFIFERRCSKVVNAID